jgi:hypothetical protein
MRLEACLSKIVFLVRPAATVAHRVYLLPPVFVMLAGTAQDVPMQSNLMLPVSLAWAASVSVTLLAVFVLAAPTAQLAALYLYHVYRAPIAVPLCLHPPLVYARPATTALKGRPLVRRLTVYRARCAPLEHTAPLALLPRFYVRQALTPMEAGSRHACLVLLGSLVLGRAVITLLLFVSLDITVHRACPRQLPHSVALLVHTALPAPLTLFLVMQGHTNLPSDRVLVFFAHQVDIARRWFLPHEATRALVPPAIIAPVVRQIRMTILAQSARLALLLQTQAWLSA